LRCRACQEPMKENEIRWDPIRKTHEDLCTKCLSIALGISEQDIIDIELSDDTNSTDFTFLYEEDEE